MIRKLQSLSSRNYNAVGIAYEAMTIGMGVVQTSNGIELPSSATTANIFFVAKEAIPTGINSVKGEIPDYDTTFESISKDDGVVLIKPIIGEKYFTNQTKGEIRDGQYLLVDTDGKFKGATSAATSNLIVRNANYTDCGQSGIKFECISKATTPTYDATLTSLALGELTLDPEFAGATTTYTVTTTNEADSITVVATDTYSTIEIKLGASTVIENGGDITWATGSNTVTVKVTNVDQTKTYTLTVTKS
jgi:hypothetical protein